MQTVFRKFPVAGVQLIDEGYECNESSCRVDLNLLGIKSSGVYRCEVSGDAPHFKLTARSANMSVEGKSCHTGRIRNEMQFQLFVLN